MGEDSSLLRVTAHGPGLYFLGLQKLRDWPRKFLDKWLLTGRGQGGVSLGTLLGIRTRLCDESVLLAALPHESSPGPSIIKPSVPAVRQPLCQAHTKMMKAKVTVPKGLYSLGRGNNTVRVTGAVTELRACEGDAMGPDLTKGFVEGVVKPELL